MPKEDDDNHFLGNKREDALKRLARRLALPGLKEPVKLQGYQIKKYETRGAVSGWEFYPLMTAAPGRCLRIFVDRRFPFTVPKVAIYPAPDLLKYPHIEADGYLCIGENDVVVDEDNVEGVVDNIIQDALQLVDDSFSGKNKSDFQDEILSYWDRAKDPGGKKIYSLIDLRTVPAAALIKIWRGEHFYLVAGSVEEAGDWLHNRTGRFVTEGFHDALFVRSNRIFESPNQYPQSGKDIHEFLKRECDAKAIQIFESLTVQFPEKINIIFSFLTKDGPALTGVTVHRPIAPSTPAKITSAEVFLKGFRPRTIPPSVAAGRYLARGASFERLNVQRVDPMWILGRDQDSRVAALLGKKAAVVGCGAIGSLVARLLAQAGIRELILIDPDKMQWENVGRHSLGARAVGNNSLEFKTALLKKTLLSDFPHLVVKDYETVWEEVAAVDAQILSTSDIIVMTTGEWSADNAMNQYSRAQQEFPPIVYGWAEAFSCAGHAVAVLKNGGCLGCAFDSLTFKFAMTTFEKEQFHVPACGATFQPFGSIELTPIIGVIAEMTTDVLLNKVDSSHIRSWLGSSQQVRDKKGAWTDLAKELLTSQGRGHGYFRTSLDLRQVMTCRVCAKRVIQECDLQTEKQ